MEDDRKSQNVACNTCYNLRRSYASGEGGGYPQVTVPLSQLVRSRQSGCLTCGVLVEIVVRCVPEVTIESDGSVSGNIDLCWIPATESQDRIWLDVFQAPGQQIQFGNVRTGRAPSGYTGSTPALNLAMEWITECISNHKLCGDGSLKSLPTRILDLGTGDQCLEARIITGDGKVSRYGTLSHCWGQRGNHRILTKATLRSWLTAFSIEELPQTYQDAIVVAKRIGLRYLWIDSLCIIQDDEEDWERESSKMADVYQNSYITIAATCAADSSVGMFSAARPIHHPRVINYSQDGIESQLHASVCLSHHASDPIHKSRDSFYHWALQNSLDLPLLTRAWVYQERLLSPRILHFMKEELVFECFGTKRCECNVFPSARMSVKEKHVKSLDRSLERTDFNTGFNMNSLRSRWHNIVEEYSELSMTFEKDKLPAISGVASQMQNLRNEKYFAGLWSSLFKEDLCWRLSSKLLGPKPKNWRAPSWSWAAVNSSVTCARISPLTKSAEIHEIVCNYSSTDMLGQLVSAWMVISGSLCRATLHRTASPDMNILTYHVRTESGHILESFFLDYDINQRAWS